MTIKLVDDNGQTFPAERTDRSWVYTSDGGDLGDLSEYRGPRVGTRCPRCGAVVFEAGEAPC